MPSVYTAQGMTMRRITTTRGPAQSYAYLRASVGIQLRAEYEAANPDWVGAWWPSPAQINARVRAIRAAACLDGRA